MVRNLLLIFGGQSTEHEVSLISAKYVYSRLNKKLYHIYPIYITKSGEWFAVNKNFLLDLPDHPNDIRICLNDANKSAILVENSYPYLVILDNQKIIDKIQIDVAFPMLHGTNGEDGAVQGLLEMFGIPYAGNGKESSVFCMDKEITKRLLDYSSIPITPFLVLNLKKKKKLSYFEAVTKLESKELFVKTVSLGSSVGVYKVRNEEEFLTAIDKAFRFDDKILIEKAMKAREIEIAVLEQEGTWIISQPGEIVPKHSFYDYSAKYIDEQGALLNCPASLEIEEVIRFQTMAKDVINALEIKGMARIDFFYDHQEKIFVNEVNTIPGFTPISMYPKLMEISGIPYEELLNQLLNEGLKKDKNRKKRFEAYENVTEY